MTYEEFIYWIQKFQTSYEIEGVPVSQTSHEIEEAPVGTAAHCHHY